MSSFPRIFVSAAGLAALLALAMAAMGQETSPQAQPAAAARSKPEWSLNATAIEACSCPMFCQCYFNDEPADHSGHGGGHAAAAEASGNSHFCLFNMAYKVNKGHHGDTDLSGAKFWISGDLGDNFSDGETEWALLRFDPSVTKEQREGLLAALPHLFPVKWKKFTVGEDAPIEWKADKERAVARLDDGKAAEIVLNAVKQRMTDEPVVIKNLVYWGAPRNDGFVLMKNERQGTRQTPEGVKPFEFTNSNGFMITIDINAEDAAKAEAARTERPAGGGDGMGH
jgi:hypothetical protein